MNPALHTLLRPVAYMAGRHARSQLRAFLRAHERPSEVQDELIERLLASTAGSLFSRDFGLDKVRTYRDLTAAVPLNDFESLRPYMDRVFAGEPEALFSPGTAIRMFAVTSGTTGAPKHVPVTEAFVDDYRRGWNIFGYKALTDHRDGWLRKIVTITSDACVSRSPTGLPCGAISGLLAQTQKWIVQRMYPVPLAVGGIKDATAKLYAILRFSIGQDVGMLTTANPSSAIKLAEIGRDHAGRLIADIRDGTFMPPGDAGAFGATVRLSPQPAAARRLEKILDRHGELIPRHYWKPAMLCLWTGGTVGLYLPRVRELFGPVPIRDIGLLASEGRMSIPLEDGTSAGAAEITSNLLEFIPAEQYGSPRPDMLRSHELEVGREYFVVLSNFAGLWRYQMDDRVRVVGRIGAGPVFEFLSRGLHTVSITGEKVTEHQVVAAMNQAAGELGVRVELFTLQGHFDQPPYYQLEIEPVASVDADVLAARLDEALRRLNVEYDGKRAGERLGGIRVRSAAPGTFEKRVAEQIARGGGRAEQYKHKYLLVDVVRH